MGLTVLDAGVLIGFLDAGDLHHGAARKALGSARERGDRLAAPASAVAETMVGPARRGPDALATVEEFLERLPVEVVPLDLAVARVAAELSAAHGKRLRLPDALVVATARCAQADALVTTDRGWPAESDLGLSGRLVVL